MGYPATIRVQVDRQTLMDVLNVYAMHANLSQVLAMVVTALYREPDRLTKVGHTEAAERMRTVVNEIAAMSERERAIEDGAT